jgi:hypothetical protein
MEHPTRNEGNQPSKDMALEERVQVAKQRAQAAK